MVATGWQFPKSAWWYVVALACWFVFALAIEAPAQDVITKVPLQGREVTGKALVKTSDQMFLLGQDGRLWHILRKDVSGRTTKTNQRFESYSADVLKNQLAQEFGRRFEVSATGQFVVVHPTGERGEWPKRFDNLYRAFVHYFSARGWRLPSPEFPLIAIVFHDQNEFRNYARSQGDAISPSVLGYYSPMSNRIVLYDQNGSGQDDRWEENAATVVHEAAHQTAFNMGIHNRFAPPPRWVTEGLGTMFEARGVCNSFRYPSLADRINAGQRAAFARYVNTSWQQGDLARFVSDDAMFDTNAGNAYAIAWALSFYLAETQPRNYVAFLKRTSSREDFSIYRSPEQLRDFTDAFGNNIDLLESRLIRYIEQLPE